jgi:hypothetical protein
MLEPKVEAPDGRPLRGRHRETNFENSAERRGLDSILAELPPVRHAWPALSPDRLTTFVCCDGPYLERHGLAFARSLDRNTPGAHLHIHLINPDADARRRAATLELPHTTLSYSLERFDFSGRSSEFARTYCASIRFVRQYQLLCASEQAVFSFDVDALVRGRLEPLRRTLIRGNYDCAVHSRLRTRKNHEKFLASAFYASPTPAGRSFLEGIAVRIASALLSGGAAWYTDQIAFYDCYRAHRRGAVPLRLYHLPKELSDWDFDKRSLLWVAKGRSKEASEIFVAHQAAYRTPEERRARLPVASTSRRRIGVVLPRLDLPFKNPARPRDLWSLIKGPGEEDLRRRRHWADLADHLSETFRERGCVVRRFDRPLWRVTTDFVEGLDVDLVLLPHKQRFHFPGLTRPAWFYKQQAFPWLFSLDPLGWGGAGARYPCDYDAGDPARGTFERYAQLIVGRNASKFAQPPRLTRRDLVARGDIPDRPYIFMPCQGPTDQSVRLFCDHDPADLVRELAGWARGRDIPVVFKAHPRNRASTRLLQQSAGNDGVYWSDASVIDLIAHCEAVYVIDSGVGFEALLHDKPVVTFGRVEYDAVTVHGELGALDRTWDTAAGADQARRRNAYRRFVDWYCRFYCVDLSDPPSAAARLLALAEEMLAAPACGAATESEAVIRPEALSN